jgi:biopolymer transport protein TolR
MIHAEINVTPLVDVCLVLLIIFMVVTPVLVTGSAVELPETRHSAALGEAPLSITVMADGTAVVGSTIVRKDEIAGVLQRLRAAEHAESVAVRGDKRVQYGTVMEVLDACRAAGWQDVKLVSLRAAD